MTIRILLPVLVLSAGIALILAVGRRSTDVGGAAETIEAEVPAESKTAGARTVAPEQTQAAVDLLNRVLRQERTGNWPKPDLASLELNRLAMEEPWILAAVVSMKDMGLDIRVLAMRKLRVGCPLEAADLILPCLAAEMPPEIRSEAVLAARRLRIAQATPAILEILRTESRESDLFLSAVRAAGAIGGKDNQQALFQFLADPVFESMESLLAESLAQGGDSEAAGFLIKRWLEVGATANGGADWTHVGLLTALPSFQPNAQTTAVAEALPSIPGDSLDGMNRRNRILSTLSGNTCEAATDLLRGVALDDPSHQVRLQAVCALLGTDRPAQAAILTEILARETHPGVMGQAAVALMKCEKKDFEAIKLAYVKSLNEGRIEAAAALGLSVSQLPVSILQDAGMIESLRNTAQAVGHSGWSQLLRVNLARYEPDPAAALEKVYLGSLRSVHTSKAVLESGLLADVRNPSVQRILLRAVTEEWTLPRHRFDAARKLSVGGQLAGMVPRLLRAVETGHPADASVSAQIIRTFGGQDAKRTLEQLVVRLSPERRNSLIWGLSQEEIAGVLDSK